MISIKPKTRLSNRLLATTELNCYELKGKHNGEKRKRVSESGEKQAGRLCM